MTTKGRPSTVAIVLTTRTSSKRCPNKALADIGGKPLIHWIAKRLGEAGKVILAVPHNDPLKAWGETEGLPVHEWELGDVCGQIINAVDTYAPDSKWIMRGLGDCPLVVPDFVRRAVSVMRTHVADAFCWATPPFTYTVYGASEFPRSRAAWELINTNARNDERIHPDLYYHRNRDKFKIVYHEPPLPIYFRPYRLEVDWNEDLELMRCIAGHFGSLPPVEDVLKWLDESNAWKVNRNRVEETGMTVSYQQHDRQAWWKLMHNQPVVMWDDTVWKPTGDGEPVFCKNRTCFLGYSDGDKLYQRDAVIQGAAYIKCACGAGRHWAPKPE